MNGYIFLHKIYVTLFHFPTVPAKFNINGIEYPAQFFSPAVHVVDYQRGSVLPLTAICPFANDIVWFYAESLADFPTTVRNSEDLLSLGVTANFTTISLMDGPPTDFTLLQCGDADLQQLFSLIISQGQLVYNYCCKYID